MKNVHLGLLMIHKLQIYLQLSHKLSERSVYYYVLCKEHCCHIIFMNSVTEMMTCRSEWVHKLPWFRVVGILWSRSQYGHVSVPCFSAKISLMRQEKNCLGFQAKKKKMRLQLGKTNQFRTIHILLFLFALLLETTSSQVFNKQTTAEKKLFSGFIYDTD